MDMVDVAFSLRGGSIPADHGWRFYQLLAERLDWLADEQNAGVHPIRGARAVAGQIALGNRARMTLRLPTERVQQARVLTGWRFELGDTVEVGDSHLRPLFAHVALYSQIVVTGAEDETAFVRDVQAALDAAGVDGKVVCGRMRRAQAQVAEVTGFALMLHELSLEDSLKVQATGLGTGRKFGCGIFVPHKSTAAVGA